MPKSITNPLIAGATGAAVGVIAVSLADKKKRREVENMVTKRFQQGEKIHGTLKKKAAELKSHDA